MINWDAIDTVLLDMDGTLLDLYFDNYFWQEYLPVYWGKLNGFDGPTAKQKLLPEFRQREGTLSWYCLDFWTSNLRFDVFKLKEDIEHLICLRPSAREFLDALDTMGKNPVMVTNAHPSLIEMKMQKTGIRIYFRDIVHSHAIGVPKEEPAFWSALHEFCNYDPERTLLIDDNLHVLRTARDSGIAHLYSIACPDSSLPARDTGEFVAITDFQETLPFTGR